MCSLHGLLGAVVEQVTMIPVQKVSFRRAGTNAPAWSWRWPWWSPQCPARGGVEECWGTGRRKAPRTADPPIPAGGEGLGGDQAGGGGRQPVPQGARLCGEAWAAHGHSGQLMVGLCQRQWGCTPPGSGRGLPSQEARSPAAGGRPSCELGTRSAAVRMTG